MTTNTDRLPVLTIASDNFDRQHDFILGTKDGKRLICRLMQGYKNALDGQYWAMQRSGMLKDSYTAEDRAYSARMQALEPILTGAVVIIDGQLHRTKVLGNYSDAAIFEPFTDNAERIKLEGKLGGWQQ